MCTESADGIWITRFKSGRLRSISASLTLASSKAARAAKVILRRDTWLKIDLRGCLERRDSVTSKILSALKQREMVLENQIRVHED